LRFDLWWDPTWWDYDICRTNRMSMPLRGRHTTLQSSAGEICMHASKVMHGAFACLHNPLLSTSISLMNNSHYSLCHSRPSRVVGLCKLQVCSRHSSWRTRTFRFYSRRWQVGRQCINQLSRRPPSPPMGHAAAWVSTWAPRWRRLPQAATTPQLVRAWRVNR
jgi:hypothetical protein